MSQLTHITERGDAHMVDVSAKADTVREARACAYVTMAMILDGQHHKGDVFATRPHRRHSGRQTHLGANPFVPSAVAQQGRGAAHRGHRAGTACELKPFAA